ncbi:hypothetical protein IBL26_03820 [Roseomonas aerophila]|uniref:Uncharacterized protein n=1 Tax=Teichococcus aerophilus TaxID=1224513 RepID=A0ABR7RHU6_9PROT|nr:hypothetical protein [Pseudoroseomonas aerophila]MBC9205953.1 hypothetical protein [Pseudoroseomonas aerophila]
MATHGLPTWPWTDAEIESLPPPEALLLEAMRRWSCAARRGTLPMPATQPPLIAEDVGDTAYLLDGVLRARGEHRFAIACPLHARLTGEEPALLLAFSLAQRGPRREALAAFLRLMPPGPAYAAMSYAISIGISFRRAGLILSNPLR